MKNFKNFYDYENSNYELYYLTDNLDINTKYFDNKSIMDNFIFSNDIYIIYIYNFKLHNYIFVGNFDEIFDLLLIKKECD